LATAFAMLEMPYSIMVFADFKFQFMIKSFEEPHSPKVLQRLLDAVMAERFAPRIADACSFAKLITPCVGHPNRAIMVISDGLDPDLKHIDDWEMDILSKKSDGFAFYFLRSTDLMDDQFAIVERMLKRFIAGIADAKSATNGLVFTTSDLLSGDEHLQNPFHQVLSHLSHVIEKDPHIFVPPIPAETRFEIHKIIQRFLPLFDLEFLSANDRVYWNCEDDFD
jgi:hypothetical protein